MYFCNEQIFYLMPDDTKTGSVYYTVIALKKTGKNMHTVRLYR